MDLDVTFLDEPPATWDDPTKRLLPGLAAETAATDTRLPDRAVRLYVLMAWGPPLTMDEIMERTGWTIGRIRESLVALRACGYVVRTYDDARRPLFRFLLALPSGWVGGVEA